MESIIEMILEIIVAIINPKIPNWVIVSLITISFGMIEFVFIFATVKCFIRGWLIAGIVCAVICAIVMLLYIYFFSFRFGNHSRNAGVAINIDCCSRHVQYPVHAND